MSTADYVGRTVDILAYQDAAPAGDVLLTQELAYQGNSGRITTGIQKLGQRFILELLTEQGTMIYAPRRGTEFLTEARQGLFRTPLDVLSAVSSALVDIQTNLQNEESDDDPLDERFESAEVLSVSLANGKAKVSIRVTSQAGDLRQIILPLSVKI